VLNQEKTDRNNPAQGMQPAKQKRMSLACPEGSNASFHRGSCRTWSDCHEVSCVIGNEERTHHYLGDGKGKSNTGLVALRAAVSFVFGSHGASSGTQLQEDVRLRVPVEELAKGLATMTVVCLLNGGKFREGLVDLWKKEEWVVTKTV